MSAYKFEQIAINSTKKKKPEEDDKYTYLGLENLDSENLEVTRFGSNVAPIGEKLLMQKGDVLFGKRRAYQKKVAIAPFDGIFSAHGMVLKPNEKVINKDFFPMFISSDKFLDEAIRISVGGLSPTINWKDLKELEFELPPLEKQEELADLLWSMEYTKRAYRKLLEQTDELVKARFVEMFGKEQNIVQLQDISKMWLKGQGLKKDEIVDNGAYECIHYGELFSKYGPYIENVNSFTNVEMKKVSEFGDILFPASDVTPNGLTKCSALLKNGVGLGGDIIVMRPVDEINPIFLSYAIRNEKDELLKRVSGALIKHLSSKSLMSVSIKMPSREEQESFVCFVKQLDKSKVELQKSLEELTAMQKKVIKQSLS